MMSVFGTLGTRNVFILFFSALSISLLVLLLLFGVFFKKIDLGVKTKDLSSAPTLGTETADPGTAAVSTPEEDSFWSPDALRKKVNLTLPEEARQLQESVRQQTASTEGNTVKRKSQKEAGVKPEEYYVGVGQPGTDDDAGLSESPTAPPTPNQEIASASADRPRVNVSQPAQSAGGSHRVYMGGFASRRDAETAQANLQAQGYSPIVKETANGVQLQLGVFSDEGKARQMATETGASVE
jgi:cell division protein FtsN